MLRCAAVRDALHRTRRSPRGAKDVLAELGGGDVAVATGVLLGATARRVPVLLDGPVGVAAGMVSRDLAGQARHWCLLADHGGHPAVRLAADVLGLTPLLDLRLDLGEGANALAALPLLRSVLALAAALPVHPRSAASTTSGRRPDRTSTTPGGDDPRRHRTGRRHLGHRPPVTPRPAPADEPRPPRGRCPAEPAGPRATVAAATGEAGARRPRSRRPEPAGPGPTTRRRAGARPVRPACRLSRGSPTGPGWR